MNDVQISLFKLESVFSSVKTGDYHASSRLDIGNMPLVSCKTENHGIEGFFDIPEEKTYVNCVTIACDGTPLTAFYHPYRIAAKDNVFVCVPKTDIRLTTIYYTIAYLNRERWRFSYGRKCYMNKKDKLLIPFPVDSKGNLDEDSIEEMLRDKKISRFLPESDKTGSAAFSIKKFGKILITDLFELHTGDYHKLPSNKSDAIPLVSCGDVDNGVIRYCSVPEGKTYQNTLTIAYNGQPLTTKYHPYRFAAKDDVAVCISKNKLRFSTLIFLQYILNSQRWRYSYGRKCFRTKLEHLELYIPVNEQNKIDEDVIEVIVSK